MVCCFNVVGMVLSYGSCVQTTVHPTNSPSSTPTVFPTSTPTTSPSTVSTSVMVNHLNVSAAYPQYICNDPADVNIFYFIDSGSLVKFDISNNSTNVVCHSKLSLLSCTDV